MKRLRLFYFVKERECEGPDFQKHTGGTSK